MTKLLKSLEKLLDGKSLDRIQNPAERAQIKDLLIKFGGSELAAPVLSEENKDEAEHELTSNLEAPIARETKADQSASLDSLDLAPEQKAKLLGMLESYDTASLTAKEDFDVQDIPSLAEIISHVLELEEERLEKILAVMQKPSLVIEPANHSIEKLLQKMNANSIYKNQSPARLSRGYPWSESGSKVSVWIVDMVSSSAIVPGHEPDKQRHDDQLRICQAYYRRNGMELVSDHTYVVALQQSLRKHEAALKKGEENPEQHIIDPASLKRGGNRTMFNQEHNSAINQVAYGRFWLGYGGASGTPEICWSGASYCSSLGSRGAVRLM